MQNIEIEWYINADTGEFHRADVLKFRHVQVTIAHPVKAPSNRAPLIAIARCPFCQRSNIQPLSRRALKDILDWGASNCLDLDANLRELFMTGICQECWDSMGEEEDD